MTDNQQRAALQRQIWQIANDVRGAVDGWDFKQYVLGSLFYRFISEKFASFIEADDDGVHYAELDDDVIKTKGYFIYPSSTPRSKPPLPKSTSYALILMPSLRRLRTLCYE